MTEKSPGAEAGLLALYPDDVKKNGLVSWGDEGVFPSYQNNFRKALLGKMNPGFLKSMPQIPESVCEAQVYEVYDGLAYLVVAKKK